MLIERGTLVIDPATVRISTLLHEAGHLSTVPSCYRDWMDGNLYASLRRIGDDAAAACIEDPDSPFGRAMVQISDPEATAWAWVAGVHIGLALCYSRTGKPHRIARRSIL